MVRNTSCKGAVSLVTDVEGIGTRYWYLTILCPSDGDHLLEM
jgi:hypothetical protein